MKSLFDPRSIGADFFDKESHEIVCKKSDCIQKGPLSIAESLNKEEQYIPVYLAWSLPTKKSKITDDSMNFSL